VTSPPYPYPVDRTSRPSWDDLTPSPAGWLAPPGSKPGWDWIPSPVAAVRLDRMPAWVRLLYRIPLADRFAHRWMWSHGGFDVFPPDHAWSINGVPED
jgi:hypothetical protein